MADKMFTSRPGVVDRGKDYERLIVANLILKLIADDNIKDFSLSSNDVNFGIFDDVVIDIQRVNQSQEKYALQLKHINNARTLSINCLEATKGNFSIKKYFNDFKKFADSTHAEFVLFTNCKFNGTGGEIIVTDDNIKIKILKISHNALLNTSSQGRCYKFEVVEDLAVPSSTRANEYGKFFNQFFLYTNQKHVDNIAEHISWRLKEMFCCDESMFEQFLSFIIKWSNLEGTKIKLDKALMTHVIAIRLLRPFIKPFKFSDITVNDQAQIFKTAIFDFNVTILDEKNCDSVKKIFGNVKNEIYDINEINRYGIKYQVISKHVKEINELTDEDCTIMLWLSGKSPLIVTQNRTTLKAINLCQTQKFVLLCADSSKLNLANLKIFRSLLDLDPESDICRKILENFYLSLQGKEKINLQTFTKDCKKLQNIITTNELVRMLDGSLTIGEEKEVLPIPHIERLVSKNIIDLKFLNKIEKDTLIVISCQGKFDGIKNHVTNFNIINIEEYLKKQEHNVNNSTKRSSKNFTKDIYISRDVCSQLEFDEICNKNQKKNKFHYFRIVDDGNLEWVKSKGGITELYEYRNNDHFAGENKIFYFNTDDMMITSDLEIVCADAGMGKSILAKNIKNQHSSTIWTVLVYVREHSSYFDKQDHDVNSFVKYILDKTRTSKEKFELKLLDILNEQRRIAFIWDGLDEIINENLQSFMVIIDKLYKKGYKQLITSRTNLKNTLENKFKAFSRTLKPFDEEEQNNYIKQRLKLSETDSKVTILQIKKNIEMAQNNDILGIPLQVFMLTELFRQNYPKYRDLLDDTFTIADLYSHFVDEKFNVYYKEKSNLDDSSEEMKQIIKKQKKIQLEQHEKVALKVFFKNEILEGLNVNCEFRLDAIRFGIITGVINEGKPSFLHDSYAEYFAASYIYKNYKKISNLKDFIFDENYKNIRFILDLLLAKNCPMHNAVLRKNYNLLVKYKNELHHKDQGGRNVLHLACSWGLRYPVLKTKKYGTMTTRYVIDDTTENMKQKENLDYQKILKFLSTKCDPYEVDELFNSNSFWYADKSLCLLPMMALSTKHTVNLNDFNSFKDISSVLYYCVKFDYSEAFKIIKNIPSIRTKKEQYSLLHLSAKYNATHCLEKILSRNIFRKRTNDSCRDGWSPIVIACMYGHTEIVQKLINFKADVNIGGKTGYTPIHWACTIGQTEIVHILINSKVNINVIDKNGSTPMLEACKKGHTEIIKILIKFEAHVNVADKNGYTPMFWACYTGHTEIVKILINSNADVNLAVKNGCIPLHVACMFGHFEIVKILIKSETLVNFSDDYGQTAMYWACKNGHTEIVQMLIDAKANVNVVDKRRCSPMLEACENGHTKIVQKLIRSNAHVNIGDKKGCTPLLEACKNQFTEIVQILIDARAQVNIADEEGSTPMHEACMRGHTEIVQILINCKADVNAANKYGETPINLACSFGRTKTIQLLTDNISNKHGDVNLDSTAC